MLKTIALHDRQSDRMVLGATVSVAEATPSGKVTAAVQLSQFVPSMLANGFTHDWVPRETFSERNGRPSPTMLVILADFGALVED